MLLFADCIITSIVECTCIGFIVMYTSTYHGDIRQWGNYRNTNTLLLQEILQDTVNTKHVDKNESNVCDPSPRVLYHKL